MISQRGRIGRIVVALLLGALLISPFAGTPAAQAARRPAVVTLTFDDGRASTLAAADTMRAAGLVGTFFITDRWVDQPGFVTRADLDRLAADGNEIGGHTVTHPALSEVSPEEQRREICTNRATLESWGFRPVSFAYPFASSDDRTPGAVASCGYHTGRGLGSIRGPVNCEDCDRTEALRPANPLWVRAPSQVDVSWTLEQLQAQVTGGRGGWTILTFHDVCDPSIDADCPATSAISPATFTAFVHWLAQYAADPRNATEIRTMDGQMRAELGSAYPAYTPAVPAPPPSPAPQGVNALVNPTLELTDPLTGMPACFERAGWGANLATYERVPPGPTRAWTERIEVTWHITGDAKLMPVMDLGQCTPTVVPGVRYELSTLYRSSGDSQFAVYYRTTEGSWHYWVSGPVLPPTSIWTPTTFTTPPVPPGADGLSFGLGLISNGVLWVDGYGLVDPGTAAAPARERDQ